MKIVSLFVLAVVVICSCSEPEPQKRVYTEKDIEGYWATNNAIHGTGWLDSLSVSDEAISNSFLRFYNDVCGLADTTYLVSDGIISVLDFNYISGELKYVPKYTIAFASKERLMLVEIKCGVEITYYSLYEVPPTHHHFDTIRLYPPLGGLGSEFTIDSLRYYPVPFEEDDNVVACSEYSPRTNRKTDSAIAARIDAMYSRLTSEDILFARSSTEFSHGYTLEMHGSRGLEMIGAAAYISNPLIRAIYWELAAAETHQIREYIVSIRK